MTNCWTNIRRGYVFLVTTNCVIYEILYTNTGPRSLYYCKKMPEGRIIVVLEPLILK